MTKQEFLAMSLPFRLKAISINETVMDYTFTLYGIEFRKGIHIPYKSKPVLRHISDLVNEIEHNGKKFMPMLELYKIVQEETEELEYNEYKTAFIPEIIASFAHFLTKDLKHGYQFNYLLPQKSFTLVHSDTREHETISQFELFQKLVEWHFDIAGLIKKGEAIDVNTLNENPYK